MHADPDDLGRGKILKFGLRSCFTWFPLVQTLKCSLSFPIVMLFCIIISSKEFPMIGSCIEYPSCLMW